MDIILFIYLKLAKLSNNSVISSFIQKNIHFLIATHLLSKYKAGYPCHSFSAFLKMRA